MLEGRQNDTASQIRERRLSTDSVGWVLGNLKPLFSKCLLPVILTHIKKFKDQWEVIVYFLCFSFISIFRMSPLSERCLTE